MSREEINKIAELFDKGYCNECNELNCLGGEPSSKNVSNAIRQLQQENKQLKEQLDEYENPKDMTLMYMYCNEKSKDKIKELQERIDKAIESLKELISRIDYEEDFYVEDYDIERTISILQDKE